MIRFSSTTPSRLFGLFVSLTAFAGAVGCMVFSPTQVLAQTTNGAAATDPNSTPAAKLGALYGASAGDLDATLRRRPLPAASLFYNRPHKPAADATTTNDDQQYRDAFEKAYRLAFTAALRAHRSQLHSTQTTTAQTSGK
jgi:hypothetical protein